MNEVLCSIIHVYLADLSPPLNNQYDILKFAFSICPSSFLVSASSSFRDEQIPCPKSKTSPWTRRTLFQITPSLLSSCSPVIMLDYIRSESENLHDSMSCFFQKKKELPDMLHGIERTKSVKFTDKILIGRKTGNIATQVERKLFSASHRDGKLGS